MPNQTNQSIKKKKKQTKFKIRTNFKIPKYLRKKKILQSIIPKKIIKIKNKKKQKNKKKVIYIVLKSRMMTKMKKMMKTLIQK